MKIAVVGATGATGRSIVSALIESPTDFEITAITRGSSLSNTSNNELRDLGVKVVTWDVKSPVEDLAKLFPGFDVVISAINAHALPDQHQLVDAAHKAKVGRFVPCFFGTAAPPRGVMRLREMKEDVLDHIRKLYLPYTAIDVGWWYQISPPRVPSGRIDSGLLFPAQHILGDGTVPSAMTDLADVGRYVAKIVADPRTLNKMVFAYSELLTQKQVWDTVEKVSGEKVERKYRSESELEAELDHAKDLFDKGTTDRAVIQGLWTLEYQNSWGIRGDNTPEHARYMGYVLGKDLYPDMEYITFERFVQDLLEGKATKLEGGSG